MRKKSQENDSRHESELNRYSLKIAVLESELSERKDKESRETQIMEQCLKTAEERMKQQELKILEVCFSLFVVLNHYLNSFI